ncbi:MAG TPA: tetratricopeptide repeat protein [bacterium]|nr:tetratricopeptide repeat protein [bacterium]
MVKKILKSIIILHMLFFCGILMAQPDIEALQKQISELQRTQKELRDQMEVEGIGKVQYDILLEEWNQNKEKLDGLISQAAAIQAEGDKENQVKHEINQGIRSLRMRQHEEAISHFDKAIEMDPNAAKAYSGKALALKNLRRYAEAEEAYKKAIELDTADASTNLNLGTLYGDQNKYDLALAQYRVALEKDPTVAKIHYQIGSVYNAQKDYSRAAEAFRKATEVDPNYALAYNALGAALIELHKYTDAIDALQKAVMLDPRFGHAYYRLAKAFNATGRYSDAIRNAEQAIEHRRELHGPAQIEIGEAHEKLGDKAKAMTAYTEAAKDRRYKNYADYKIEQLKKN